MPLHPPHTHTAELALVFLAVNLPDSLYVRDESEAGRLTARNTNAQFCSACMCVDIYVPAHVPEFVVPA